MKVLFLVPYPLGESPSQRFRFEQYFHILEQQHIHPVAQSFWSDKAWRILYHKGKHLHKLLYFLSGVWRRWWMLFTLNDYEFVFIHREVVPLGPPFFEWIIGRLLRKKIIYDFDDAIWIPNTSVSNRISSWLKWHSKVSSICRWSYRVSCGNSFLANFAKTFNTNVWTMPTTIDTEKLHNPALFKKTTENKITIGWTGTHSTLPFLTLLVPVLKSLTEKYSNVQILIIADSPPEWKIQRLIYVPWDLRTEIADLMRIDIGIMPLPDDAWAKGKCGFKALQYLSLEKPALVTPVGVNATIVDHQVNGFHCRTAEEWQQYLEYLISHREMWGLLGQKGREKVIDQYSIKAQKENFLSLFQ